MAIAWSKVLPVLISIAIIITVAVLRERSQTLAAVVATMPINLPLALWIVYGADDTTQATMAAFSESLLIKIWPTILFLVIVWLAARAGWSLIPMIAAGYVGWGIGLGGILLLQRLLGG